MSDLPLQRGPVSDELREEFPHLSLWTVELGSGSGRTPRVVKERLRQLSNRYTGGKAVQLRQEPIPWAYRVFFRQIGLDPDEHRTPPEELALQRMKSGGFPSRNLLDDAITIATVETGIPIVAFDAERMDGPLGVRLARPGERLGGEGRELSDRQVVLADSARALGVLFADIAEGRGVRPETRRMVLASVQVKGVPEVAVEEAMWIVAEIITGEGVAGPPIGR